MYIPDPGSRIFPIPDPKPPTKDRDFPEIIDVFNPKISSSPHKYAFWIRDPVSVKNRLF
jgi:hypothetical protein